MKIAFVTHYDAADPSYSNFSGAGFYIAKCLYSHGLDVEFIGSLRTRYEWLGGIKKLFFHYMRHELHPAKRDLSVLKAYGRLVNGRLASSDADLVFCPGTLPIAFLDCDKPIVFWTDATFAGLHSYYPEFSGMSADAVRTGHLLEQSALQRCALAIYWSDWAARTAVDYYGCDPSKIRVLGCGPNLRNPPSAAEVQDSIASRSRTACSLILIGADWQRKGGDIAFRVAERLNQDGFETTLTVVGGRPDSKALTAPFMKYVGFLNKQNPEAERVLATLLSQSHFLILPTRAECYGIAFSEASAFGVPSITTDTGGVGSAVKEGINGHLLPPNATVDDYCDVIKKYLKDRNLYATAAMRSREYYQTNLSWDCVGRGLIQHFESVLRCRGHGVSPGAYTTVHAPIAPPIAAARDLGQLWSARQGLGGANGSTLSAPCILPDY